MLSSLMFPLFLYRTGIFVCGTDRAFRAAAQRFRKIQIPLQGSLSDWLQQKRKIRRMILKQLAGYYLCPACVSLCNQRTGLCICWW